MSDSGNLFESKIEFIANYVIIRRGSFIVGGRLDCDQDRWTTLDHPDLPAPVRFHPGHLCTNDSNSDNLWIDWNDGQHDQHIDVSRTWLIGSGRQCLRPATGGGALGRVYCWIKLY